MWFGAEKRPNDREFALNFTEALVFLSAASAEQQNEMRAVGAVGVRPPAGNRKPRVSLWDSGLGGSEGSEEGRPGSEGLSSPSGVRGGFSENAAGHVPPPHPPRTVNHALRRSAPERRSRLPSSAGKAILRGETTREAVAQKRSSTEKQTNKRNNCAPSPEREAGGGGAGVSQQVGV